MRDDVHVGDEGRLENNGDVGSVEQLDWVGRVLATVTDGFDGKIHTETYFHLQLVKNIYITSNLYSTTTNTPFGYFMNFTEILN